MGSSAGDSAAGPSGRICSKASQKACEVKRSPGNSHSADKRAAIPIGHFRFGAGLTDAVDRRQQQIMSGRGSGAGPGPEGLQQIPDAGLLRCCPEGHGKAKLARRRGQRDGGGAIAHHLGQLLGGAEVSLMNNAGLALDAGAFDHVVIELVAFLLGHEAWHNRVIQYYLYPALSSLKCTDSAEESTLYRVIPKSCQEDL